ncbi:F-box/LRR-repeat LRR-repeat 17-like [Octopus vulgaris]|uniref:F-box/LRR-repeat LRR-repeat 17-like n=1 Tax=Octopus vulgaris TaxID=6645 RepID=A0AA36FF36_OCTVU|nr:F-box/LRR-repeat LRR-repeat 17-like [Octopus vulgaris]
MAVYTNMMADDSGKLHTRTLKRCPASPTRDNEQLCKVRRGNNNKMINVGVETGELSVRTISDSCSMNVKGVNTVSISLQNSKDESNVSNEHDKHLTSLPQTQETTSTDCSNLVLSKCHSSKYHCSAESTNYKISPSRTVFSQQEPEVIVASKVISLTQDTSEQKQDSEVHSEHTNGVPSPEDSLHILNLPSSILLEIFKYLTIPERIHSVELVCKKWYELAKDPSLWRHINFQDFGHKTLSDEILDKITSYSNHVVHLDISNTMGFSPEGISSVLKKCRWLSFLSLKGCCSLPDSTIQLIAENQHDLEQLYLDDCFCVTNPTIVKIFHNCPRITHLSFGWHLNAETVDTMANYCTRLKLINLSHCDAVDSLARMLQNCKQLENVNLSDCPLTDSHLVNLCHLPNLKHVYLNSVNMSSTTAKEVAKHCLKLQTLSLCFNDCVDDDCITAVVQNARNLRILKCIRCNITDKALIAIAKHSSKLEQLDVSFCSNITNKGVNFVSENCTQLYFLGLFSCEKVESTFLFQLQKDYPHIRIYCFELEYKSLIERVNEEDRL